MYRLYMSREVHMKAMITCVRYFKADYLKFFIGMTTTVAEDDDTKMTGFDEIRDISELLPCKDVECTLEDVLLTQ